MWDFRTYRLIQIFKKMYIIFKEFNSVCSRIRVMERYLAEQGSVRFC